MTQLVDASGRPLVARADAGYGGRGNMPMSRAFPYQAADWQSQEMATWLPWLRSPDAEINQFRDRMVARQRDLVRNDGWASGGVERILDATVGATLRLAANPDYRALAQITGNKGFDAVWAAEFRRAAEAEWRLFAEDIRCYADISRTLPISAMFRLALRHKLIDGDSLIVAHWRPDRVGAGRARYATAFGIVDPDRLSNPMEMVDDEFMRGGVELDLDGVPVAYHIRKAEPNDYYLAMDAMVWERVVREDPDGFRRVFHDYERHRAGQHRGVGVFTPVLAHMKMLARYYGVELQAAVIAAALGLYVTSPYDPAQVEEAIDSEGAELSHYQGLRADWAEKRPALFNGARVPTLAPGESIQSVSSAHPHNSFSAFAQEMQRMFSAASGVPAHQLSQDYSKANYSSLRAAEANAWKTLIRRRVEFSNNTCTPMFATLLEEAFEHGRLPLPSGNVPAYRDAITAYARCKWLGPGRDVVDPVKERQGSVLGMDAGLSTLQEECETLSGGDWEENIDQRALEVAAFRERGLPPPRWFSNDSDAGSLDNEITDKPTPETA